jgi:hypothetical protein
MSISHDTTIKDKMTAAIVAICTLVLACAGTILIVCGQTAFLETTSNHLSTLAEMIATNSKASLAFEDAKDALETLKILRNEPSIVLGSIYTRRGQVLAAYYRDNTGCESNQTNLAQLTCSSGFDDGFLTALRTVVLDNEIIGAVWLRADLNPIFVMLKRDTTTAIVLLLFVSWGFMLLIYSSVKKSIRSIATLGGNNSKTLVLAEAES